MKAIRFQQSPTWRMTDLLKPLFSSVHSTAFSLANWNRKSKDGRVDHQPCKTHFRYVVRQKRSDTKKALKDLLLYDKPSKVGYQHEGPRLERKSKIENTSSDLHSQRRSTRCRKASLHDSSDSRKGKKYMNKSMFNKWSWSLEDEETSYGGRFHSFTWTPHSENFSAFQDSATGFEWREEVNSEKAKRRFLRESDVDESEEESTGLGSYSCRAALGLPVAGPLKLDDVKAAFRESALKWHPDRHQGSSQAAAQEKFKLCVDAYNSLRNELSLK